ncbi:hypothetical protein NIES4101_85930 [Calothrix sp. NIES-4101]|nr:hypothetical protein NIES4101_85930 [Calothrix sp. NIES-4101]
MSIKRQWVVSSSQEEQRRMYANTRHRTEDRTQENINNSSPSPLSPFLFPSLPLSLFLILLLPNLAFAQTNNLQVTVNSNADGEIQADEKLTLREAIAISNGMLPLEKLSPSEREQVKPSADNPRIEFNLPAGQTKIQLDRILPPLTAPGLVVDGTTQPGYDANNSATAEIDIPVPVVEIIPAPSRQIFRGLTVIADKVTIKGLSLYGFTKQHGVTASTPPADILIGYAPFDRDGETEIKQAIATGINLEKPPQNVTIENNWLGMPVNEQMPATYSAFGVSVFNAQGATIRRNRISYHDGSAIITSKLAENTQITENIIVANGLAGMPDAIRLEGIINGTQISSNFMCGNDGSAAYLFKPQGAISIKNNQIKYNGRRFRRAAIFLMGSKHQVTDNQISHQAGAGVVVTAFPNGGSFHGGSASGNMITNNRFTNLEGLSIDLNTTRHVGVQDFQNGDGRNKPRDSSNRHLDTGNASINAPRFLAPEFLIFNDKVNLDGIAEPKTQVQIYRIGNGGLSEILTTVTANEKGRFAATFANLQPGDMVSAIATHPQYGTSEPAENAVIVAKAGEKYPEFSAKTGEIPTCTTRPPAKPEPTPEPEPPATIRLRVPQNIHFALDQDFISDTSASVLDQIAAVLQQYPHIVIELQGHTDSRASNAYNQNLGFRRATNARNYLINKGISAARMTIRSLGETELKTPGRNSIEHAYNRRVEVMFFDVRGVEIILESQEQDLQIEK